MAKKSSEKALVKEETVETDVKVSIWDSFWKLEKPDRDEEVVEDQTDEKREFRWF